MSQACTGLITADRHAHMGNDNLTTIETATAFLMGNYQTKTVILPLRTQEVAGLTLPHLEYFQTALSSGELNLK